MEKLSFLDPLLLKVIEMSSDFFGIADENSHAIYINSAGRRIFGIGQDQDVSSLKILDFFPPSAQEEFQNEVVKKSFEHSKIEKTIPVKNFYTGEIFNMSFDFSFHKGLNGSSSYFIAFGKDLRSSVLNKERLSSMGKALSAGSWELDLNSGETTWSEEIYKIYGIPKDTPTNEIQGISFYAPHERERITKLVENCIKLGKPFDEEFEFFNQQGEKLWVRSVATSIRNSEGEIYKLAGTFQDITKKKLTELELERTVHRLKLFEAVIENTTDFVGIADNNFTPIYLNPAGRDMVGIPLDKDINEVKIAECYPPDLMDFAKDTILSQMLKNGSWTGETYFRHFLTNQKIPVHDIHFMINDPITNDPLGHATITRDMTHQKKLQDKVEEERIKMIQASKLATLGEISAGIAHEINNPLAIIDGSISILKNKNNDPYVLEKADKIQKSTERISRIVKGLKKFSRTSQNLNKSVFSLKDTVIDCIDLILPNKKIDNLEIRILIDEDIMIYADEIQIEQILINLIKNSIEENSNEDQSWIEIKSYIEQGLVHIIIQDSGQGIETDKLEKIFQPFYTTKPTGQGTGLGLAVSKGIAQSHGGDLVYKNLNGHTAFILKIPEGGI